MRCLEYPFDSAYILKKKRSIKRELLACDKKLIRKRIAVLGGSTTREIVDILELFLLNHDIYPEFYESGYNQYLQEALFPTPEFLAFKPDIIYIHTGFRNITSLPSPNNNPDDVNSLLKAQYDNFSSIWQSLRQQFKCPVIQNNFERPPYRLFGNLDISDYRGHSNFVFRLNQLFYEYAQTHESFYIHDIDYLSCAYGLTSWSDPFSWYMYKYFLNVKAIPDFAHNLANIIKSVFGKNKKGIVLDLDNTLWGGVVGDDGVSSLKLGPEFPAGQAYQEFQKYIKAHKEIGVFLSVSSKNELQNALAGLKHPDSVLAPEDFSAIEASWDNKDNHVVSIAKELNVTVDSLIFVDDNPVERNLIRETLGICAPELESIENFRNIIDGGGYFEVTGITEEDKNRVKMHDNDIKRGKDQNRFADYNKYLLSLEMKAYIGRFRETDLTRITQLTNKTNQFNLTAKRFTENQLAHMAQAQDYLCLCGRLSDKYGDNGVVSIIAGQINADKITLTLWLMSCRVFKRGMELAMFDEFVKDCLGRGINTVKGIYVPTGKNELVRGLYESMGFRQCGQNDDGNDLWLLDINDYTNKNQVIKVERK